MEGSPKEIGGYFACNENLLETLEGCPSKVRTFYCYKNKLTSLEGGPKEIWSGLYNANDNNLTSFDGVPDKIKGGDFLCESNPVYEVWNLFLDYSKMELFIDLDPIRDNKVIILDRLNEFLDMIGKPKVTSVKGYKCI